MSMLIILVEPLSFLMNEIVVSRIILFKTMFDFSLPNSKRLLSASLSKTEKGHSKEAQRMHVR